jgi:HK97 family phage prohead protease
MENKDYIKSIEGAERRYFSSEVRATRNDDANDANSVIEGYAAKFNSETVIGNYWQYREVILPGAFDDVLNDDIRALFNHDPNQILARSINGKGTLEVFVDATGLKYRYTTPDRSYAKDLQNAIDTGDVSQSSFAFKIKEQRWIEKEGDMELREIVSFEKLYDVSPVTYPAYADTEVAKRSLDAAHEKNPKEENNDTSEVRNEKEMSALEAQIFINQNL